MGLEIIGYVIIFQLCLIFWLLTRIRKATEATRNVIWLRHFNSPYTET